MKIYFIGKRSSLPRKYREREEIVSTDRWMSPIRTGAHEDVAVVTWEPRIKDTIDRVVSGHRWPCHQVFLEEKHGVRVLYITILRRAYPAQGQLQL